jgi:glutathione synthase/RimK-type ligase-like ATP-grasp enzyme
LGLRFPKWLVPDTLVTQNRAEVTTFVDRHRGNVVVKPVVGMASRFLLTRSLEHPELIDDESYRICPAIYQEYIPGTRHIRLNCFGDRSYAACIESTTIDWRPNLDVCMSPWPVPDKVHAKVRNVLDQLGLAMGIIDIKEDPEGQLVWFEVNPQGQFLFLEPLTGLELTNHFADFLIEEWNKAER